MYTSRNDEILREKNYVIYKYYQTILNETDIETRKDMIRAAMNDIINTLDPSSSNVYPRENWNFECLNPTSSANSFKSAFILNPTILSDISVQIYG